MKIIHEALEHAIKRYKMQIKHHEQHGKGKIVMEQKRVLQEMIRRLEKYKTNGS